MIYVDPTALLAMVQRQRRGRALARWLNEDRRRVVLTSVLSEIELHRALRVNSPDLLPLCTAMLGRVNRYEVDREVRLVTASFGPDVSTTSAVHVATALVVLGERAEAFVTYDRDLAVVARSCGLPVRAPQR